MTLFEKCQTFFHQTSMHFHSAVATLEPQKYVFARTVGTENILLVSGRLVCFFFCISFFLFSYQLVGTIFFQKLRAFFMHVSYIRAFVQTEFFCVTDDDVFIKCTSY